MSEIKQSNTIVGSREMELYPKRKNDDQYIKAVRKQTARSRNFGIFHACVVLFFLGAFLALSHLIHSVDGLGCRGQTTLTQKYGLIGEWLQGMALPYRKIINGLFE